MRFSDVPIDHRKVFAFSVMKPTWAIAVISNGAENYLIFGWVTEYRGFYYSPDIGGYSIPAKIVNNAMTGWNDAVRRRFLFHWLAFSALSALLRASVAFSLAMLSGERGFPLFQPPVLGFT